ncbi:MAG: uracil-DNA glycosylase [Oscillospiraceae bacterium]|nr:uracil-DNA glycosylase [Oscillospiraceae bacterium]
MKTNLIGNNWDEILKDAFQSEAYQNLRGFLKSEYGSARIYPPMNDIFNALKFTPPENVKIVLIGQDPYINEGQAHGLAFSVKSGLKPPSLQNIYKELHSDLGILPAESGCLIPWAQQGVLLLNTVLTVRAGLSNSHKGKGWEFFTDAVIKYLGEREYPTVFFLWGNNAKEKERLITNPNHLILKAPHPSPLSASYGFFGCGHFSKANAYLEKEWAGPIEWKIEN